ncbi:hypothetical protein AB0J57_07880 [Streptomyces sp. NPDC049837]
MGGGATREGVANRRLGSTAEEARMRADGLLAEAGQQLGEGPEH